MPGPKPSHPPLPPGGCFWLPIGGQIMCVTASDSPGSNSYRWVGGLSHDRFASTWPLTTILTSLDDGRLDNAGDPDSSLGGGGHSALSLFGFER